MTEGEEDAVVAAIVSRAWAANIDKVTARFDAVLRALDAHAVDEAAAAEAHALAGALGTYGRPGSPLLKEAERALRTGEGDRTDLAARVGLLREQVVG